MAIPVKTPPPPPALPPIAPTSTYQRTVPVTPAAPPPGSVPPTMGERKARQTRLPQQIQAQRQARQQPQFQARGPGAGGTEAVFPTDGGAIRNGNMGSGGAFNMSPFKNQAGPWGQQTKAPMSTGQSNPFAGAQARKQGGFAGFDGGGRGGFAR